MSDAGMIAALIAAFLAAGVYVRLCERLLRE